LLAHKFSSFRRKTSAHVLPNTSSSINNGLTPYQIISSRLIGTRDIASSILFIENRLVLTDEMNLSSVPGVRMRVEIKRKPLKFSGERYYQQLAAAELQSNLIEKR
jgi:hypothetical protein